jgi:uncharacterized protein (DUF608 family)
MNRREFAKVAGMAGIACAMEGIPDTSDVFGVSVPPEKRNTVVVDKLFPTTLPTKQWVEFWAAGFSELASGVISQNSDLRATGCGMPLGGIGTGCVDLNCDGRFGYCTIFNRVWGWDYRDRVYALARESLGLSRKAGGATGATATPVEGGVIRDLSPNGRGPLDMPFLGLSVGSKTWILTTRQVGEIETAKKIYYWGHYPVADLEYELVGPVSVGLRAWSPFLPGDVDRSQLPGAVFEVNLRNLSPSNQTGALAFSFPGPTGETREPWLRHRRSEKHFSGAVVQGSKASYAVGAIDEQNFRVGGGLGDDAAAWGRIAQELPEAVEDDPSATVAVDFALAPGEQKAIRFLLTWHTPEWESEFPYGFKLSRYTNRYTQQYPSALDSAWILAADHGPLLQRILAWQQVIYAEKGLPVWLRDQLINSLHLITEESYWAVAKPPLGDWCHQGGLFSLVESTVAAGQQSCIPCDWYGNLPIVYFFPELAWSTLRAYRAKMREDGAAPFYLGQGLDLAGGQNGTNYAHDRQQIQNGCCYADLVDRLWLITGNDDVLREFYPSVKKNVIYTMTVSQDPGPESVLGVIRESGDEWYESMNMQGITAHAGGTRLAQLRICERMSEQIGDTAFAQKCRHWLEDGSKLLEETLWNGDNYLLSMDVHSGKKNDLVLAYQLDGEWITHLHGLPGVFDSDRVHKTLTTIKKLNSWVPINGAIDVIERDGRLTQFGDRMGWMCSMPASVLILAMTYLYAGHHDEGIDLAYKCLDSIINQLDMTWDIPNMVRSDPGAGQLPECMRIYGTDYYQFLSIWGLPPALNGEDLRQVTAPGGLITRIIEAARHDSHLFSKHSAS